MERFGLGFVLGWMVGIVIRDLGVEGIRQGAPSHPNKRKRFDKDGMPFISKGILIRADIDRKYGIKAKIMEINMSLLKLVTFLISS